VIWKLRWKQVPGFPNYWVCEDGRVMNLRRKAILEPYWAGKSWAVSLANKDKHSNRSPYRLVKQLFGEIDEDRNAAEVAGA